MGHCVKATHQLIPIMSLPKLLNGFGIVDDFFLSYVLCVTLKGKTPTLGSSTRHGVMSFFTQIHTRSYPFFTYWYELFYPFFFFLFFCAFAFR